MRQLVLAAITILVPFQALAGWVNCPGDVTDASTLTVATSPDNLRTQSMCYRFTHDGTTDPPRVDTRRCIGGVDVSLDSDKTTAGANHDVTAFIYQCSQTGLSTSRADCEKILVDTDGDGLANNLELNGDPATSRDAIYGISPTWLAFDVTANASGRTAEIKVVCR